MNALESIPLRFGNKIWLLTMFSLTIQANRQMNNNHFWKFLSPDKQLYTLDK